MAAADNLRVMLSGWGGDEFAAFNGRGYFAALFLKARWGRLIREMRGKCRLHNVPMHRLFRSRVLLPVLPEALLARIRPDLSATPRRSSLPECLAPGFGELLAGVEPIAAPQLREWVGVQRNQIALYAHGHLAERMESWAEHGARHRVEYRYPLLDRRVVEFALGVPAHLFHKDGWKRHLFRYAVKNLLPTETQWRKMKSDPAGNRWMARISGDADQMVSEVLLKRRKRMRAAGYIDPDCAVSAWMDSMRSVGEPDGRAARIRDSLWLGFLDPAHHSTDSLSPDGHRG
jgi:asparagine synthase (glutamine-hydrolysing)